MEREEMQMEVTHGTEIPNPWYQNITLEDAETFIGDNLKSAVRSVIAIGFYLKCIRDGNMYEAEGYLNIWDYAWERFGFSKSTASRYMGRNDKFSKDGNSPILDDKYREYSKSQLQEMLSLDAEQLEQVTPAMTVKEIRQLRKPEREIPYIAIPGQMEVSDFLDMEEPDPPREELSEVNAALAIPNQTMACVMQASDFLGADAEPIATSQQEEIRCDLEPADEIRTEYCNAAASDEITVDTNTCPPGNGNCRRQEWGTSPEEQKAGHKECVKCWEDWKKMQMALKEMETNAAEPQQEEFPEPNENWNLGDLPQVKEKHLKQLAEKLVEKMGSRIVMAERSSIPSDETIKKYIQVLARQEGGVIALEDGVEAFTYTEIIEFSRGDEDFGVCSYIRLANQVRKALEGWAEQEERPANEVESNTETKLSPKEVLEEESRKLDTWIKSAGETPSKTDQHMIERQKYIVCALASMVSELENEELKKRLEEIQPKQPELPQFKNNDERKAWLDNYEAWGLWYEDEHVGAKYYKYDFPDGTRLIADVYQNKSEYAGTYESSYLHLVGGPKQRPKTSFGAPKYPYHEKYNRYPDSITELIEFLKDVQKGSK